MKEAAFYPNGALETNFAACRYRPQDGVPRLDQLARDALRYLFSKR